MIATFSQFELRITKKDAISCSHPGPCDNDILALSRKPYIARQLATLNHQEVCEELEAWGAWSDNELSDHSTNLHRLLWLACLDITQA